MSTALLLLGTCIFSAAVSLKSDWNKAARDHILKIHNDYRRGEGACQMDEIVYDEKLETAAKKWAEGCVFEHEMVKGRGENLAWNSATKPEAELITKAAQAWFDEKKDYRPGQRACSRSCHYTQMVWHNTQKVGCWSTRCPNLVNAYKNAWYLVCFYTPMGNWVGEPPYKTKCDKPCLPGQTKKNGLCVGEAKVPCEDKNDSCAGWAKTGECKKNPAWMLKNCKKSCKVCH